MLLVAGCGERSRRDVSDPAADASTETTGQLPVFELDASRQVEWAITDAVEKRDKSFVPAAAPRSGDWKAISYTREQLPDASASLVLIGHEEPLSLSGDVRSVQVNRAAAMLGQVYVGDGAYETAVTWSPSAGVHVSLIADNRQDRVDLLAVAAGVHTLSEREWSRLKKGVQARWRDARNDPESHRVEVLSGEVAGQRWTLTAIVPPDYPLGPWDRRQICAELSLDEVVARDTRCGEGWSLPLIGAHRFVFGSVAPDASSVTVRSVEPDGTASPAVDATAALSAARSDVPVRFYVTVLDDAHCYYQVTGARNWSPTAVIRPLGRPNVDDPCALADVPPPVATTR
jgi:hypothetical protein